VISFQRPSLSKSSSRLLGSEATAVTLIFFAMVVLHAPILRLPYFWDEAGYYIPAARDFFLHGYLVPVSTLSSAHPPLLMMYLAVAWKLFGYSPLVTHTAMLLIAAFAVVQVYRLSEQLAGEWVALATSVCFALYPVFFAQAALAHSDLPATALTLLGLRIYFKANPTRWQYAAAFALATLAKEIAILTPVALAAWELMSLAIGVWLAKKLSVKH
jgi:4-amino-4-deoxy-L-arabinose transferase-like glycosyltransferase